MKLLPRPLIAAVSIVGAIACTSPSTTQAKAAGSPAVDATTPAAKIGSDTISVGQVDETIKADVRKAEQQFQEQLYQMRRQGLEEMILKRLVEAKAKAAGKSTEELLKTEVVEKVGAPTDAEIKAEYDKAAAQAKAAGRDLPPLDGIKEAVSRYIQQQKAQALAKTYYDKLKAEAKVEILLPAYRPPRMAVEAKGPFKGPESAPVTIVEFSDFECPYCSRGEEVIAEVLRAYPGKIKLHYRDFPLPMHPNAPKAAEAAHCAGDQGKYWEMHAKLFANQRALDVASLKGYAKSLGLDQGKFDKCLDGGEKAKLVEEGKRAGAELGVNGTPAFFINGVMINGAQPFDAFKEVIDAELAPK